MDYKKQIKKIIESRKFGKVESITKLGLGENNINYLAIVDNKKLVFRIALRKEIEKNMKREFESLKKIPKGFGPKPIYFDNSKKIIPKVYSIQSFVPGKSVENWTNKHLRLHAKKLAKLHKKRYNKKFDLYKLFRVYLKEFEEVLNDKDVNVLLPKIIKYIKANNHYFLDLKRFSLTHGDPYTDNILFTDNDVHYVDWEWTKIGDNAEDVCRFFDEDCSYLPWKIKLSGKRLDYFFDIYLKYHKDKTLKQRIEIWNIFYKFFDMLYCKKRLKKWEKTNLPKEFYQKTVRDIIKVLKSKFKDG